MNTEASVETIIIGQTWKKKNNSLNFLAKLIRSTMSYQSPFEKPRTAFSTGCDYEQIKDHKEINSFPFYQDYTESK